MSSLRGCFPFTIYFKIFEYGDSKINEKFELFWQQQKERKVVVSILYDSFKLKETLSTF